MMMPETDNTLRKMYMSGEKPIPRLSSLELMKNPFPKVTKLRAKKGKK
jgi:hypothetical protein